MARREIVIGSAAGVQLIEVVHRVSRQVFSRYAVTTLRGPGRRDFVSLRGARQAFEEEVAASRRLKDGRGGRTVMPPISGDRLSANAPGSEGLDGQP